MWAGESAILLCDGSNWFKIAGKSIPMTASAYRDASQSISDNTWTKINIDTAVVNNTGLMLDTTTNYRITIPRTSQYSITTQVGFQAASSVIDEIAVLAEVNRSGSVLTGTLYAYAATCTRNVGANGAPTGQQVGALTAGDIVELACLQLSGVSQNLALYTNVKNILTVVETPTW
jgi:hypothetical protein